MKNYQIIQERYAHDDDDEPTQDACPILFATVEEARAEFEKRTAACLFEHTNNVLSYHLAEVTSYLDGVTYTGRTFPI